MLKTAVIIPCRMAATRFPGKPLTPILGLPMIEHVYKRCVLAVGADSVWIATCDSEIEEAAKKFHAPVIMTANTHTRCTDRVAEAALKINADIIVNVQGDEPVLNPQAIHDVLKPFKENKNCYASNLIQKINPEIENPTNYNIVKVVFNNQRNALYFSREPIPTQQRASEIPQYFKQLGVMAFSRSFLQIFSKLPQTPLEILESVDMLRVLEHGYALQCVETQFQALAIDVPQDIPPVEEALKKDSYFKQYS